MANQLKMALVQSIITLHSHGWSRRRIARELGIHRETVGRYVDRWESRPATNAPTGSDDSKPASNAPLGWGAAKPLSHAPTGSPSAAAGWRSIIIDKLDQGLSAQRIYQDLIGDHGYTGSYYSVRRLPRKLSDATPTPFRRMECEPAAEAQVRNETGTQLVLCHHSSPFPLLKSTLAPMLRSNPW